MSPTVRRFVFAGVPALAALLLAALLTWLLWPDPYADLRDRDPHGAAACKTLADWIEGEIDGDHGVARFAVGEDAYFSTTTAIAATAVDIAEGSGLTAGPMYVARIETLYTACEDAGVDMPDPAGMLTPW